MKQDNTLAYHYLSTIQHEFSRMKALADGALAQIDDTGFTAALDDEANSIAVIIKHMTGNMRSRWTDFLTSDGEKPDRNRDAEFVVEGNDSREDLARRWEEGWEILFEALDDLKPGDLLGNVTIRGESLTVVQAIERQLSHYAYHVGQIVLLAKRFRSGEWRSLSIPRGGSASFNADPQSYLAPEGSGNGTSNGSSNGASNGENA